MPKKNIKIVISDFENVLNRDLKFEIQQIQKKIPQAQVVIHPYKSRDDLYQLLTDADGLLTAYLAMDKDFFDHCPSLKAISINATGYTCLDLAEAKARNVSVCAIRDYCTDEVADFTLALLLNLAKKIKAHEYNLVQKNIWNYEMVGEVMALRDSSLAIFGFGKIGQAVATRAKAFGLKILAVDPYLPEEVAEKLGCSLVTPERAMTEADIISNHMSVSDKNTALFDKSFFTGLKKKPIFLNLARGASLDEDALVNALDQGLVSAAGLDVLIDENPDTSRHPLFNRNNVIITPHAAFYSQASMKKLQIISCNNLCYCLTGNFELTDHLL
ncbi:NAD(P)-dependent oxidoreductase [Eubacteriaceae bacterium ES2]|nr:NAD(P)-dependent oxidoreductase [Eubacteriaceae bacterium ES2]